MLTGLIMRNQYESGPLTPSNIIGIVFFGNCWLISLFFFQFSMKFRKLLVQWTAAERNLDKSGFIENPDGWPLKKKLGVFLIVTTVLALSEHLLSWANHYGNLSHRINDCNQTSGNLVEDFITSHLGFVYPALLKYNLFFGIVSEYVNITCTIYWNFVSMFIMIVSIGLACNFEKINYKMRRYTDMPTTNDDWCEVRECYNELSDLLKSVDRTMGKMIFLACMNDSYFILMQLLNVAR